MSTKDKLINIFCMAISFISWVYAIAFTAICWVVTLILSVYCIVFDRDRKIIHSYATLWAKWIVWTTPVWKVKVVGRSNIGNGPYVFVSNHQSLGDILCLYFINRQFKFIAKKDLFDTPFVGWGMRLIHYIPLERGDKNSAKKSFEVAAHFLRNKVSVMVFPEGTRSIDGKIGPFKRGAFRMAIINKIPIVPLVISGTRNAMRKGEWYFRPRANVKIFIGKPIDVTNYSIADSNTLRERVRNLMIERLERSGHAR